MSLSGHISRQFTDVLAYVLIPAAAVITTASFSRRILRRVSGWDWFLADAAESAFAGARKHVDIPDEEMWKRRWKQVELLDARDLYMMLFGRSRSVLAEIERPSNFESARDRVMVGMHWGPAISILKLLAVSDLRPAFPFRAAERHLLRSRPFYYLFSRLVGRYLARTLDDRAVPVGGAVRVLQGLLDAPGSICVLMDAPHMQGRPAICKTVLGASARFNAGFPALLAERSKEYVLYAMNLSPDGSVRKKLEMAGPFRAEDADGFLDNYAGFLDRHLASDSPHWRIWHAEYQFWNKPTQAPGQNASGDHQKSGFSGNEL
jgi:hypothetical protein